MAPTSFILANGQEIPSIGLGTWQSAWVAIFAHMLSVAGDKLTSSPGEVAKAVEHALRNGYRHIDCAWAYGNEAEVGEGIKNSGVARREIFVTSKLFELHHHPEHVELAIRDTLKNLGLDYLDLYLMHWNLALQVDAPSGELPTRAHTVRDQDGRKKLDVPLSDDVIPTWKAMEKLVGQGLTKSIGVSNFNINRVKRLLAGDISVKPIVNQIELSLQCPQHELVEWLKRHDIVPCAFSPLGGTDGTNLRDHETIKAIATKHSVQGATVLISWLIKRGIAALPKSVTPTRIDANLQSIDLSDEEFQRIDDLAKSHPPKREYYDIYQENDPEYSDKVMSTRD